MGKLEDFVSNNREQFEESYDIDSGWEKLQNSKNDKRDAKILWLSNSRVYKVAAVALIFFGLGYLANQLTTEKSQDLNSLNQPIALVEVDSTNHVPAEVYEARSYYSSLIDKQMLALKEQVSDSLVIRQIENDFRELDMEYEQLSSELKINADNQRIIEAMIENYRLRIRLLERTIERINKETNNEIEKYI